MLSSLWMRPHRARPAHLTRPTVVSTVVTPLFLTTISPCLRIGLVDHRADLCLTSAGRTSTPPPDTRLRPPWDFASARSPMTRSDKNA